MTRLAKLPSNNRPKVKKASGHNVFISPCAHCERDMNNFAGGYSRGYNNEFLCHPNEANRPDCYRLVTVYGHITPCDKEVCYENHSKFTDYLDDNRKVPF